MNLAFPTRKFSAAVLYWLAASAAVAQSAANGDPWPTFQPFRYDEDWSSLADSTTQTDWLDRLKYLSLGRTGWFAALGGEIRERFELLDQPNFGAGPEDDNGYFLQRYLLSSDFHFGPNLRVFTELQSGSRTAAVAARVQPI